MDNEHGFPDCFDTELNVSVCLQNSMYLKTNFVMQLNFSRFSGILQESEFYSFC